MVVRAYLYGMYIMGTVEGVWGVCVRCCGKYMGGVGSEKEGIKIYIIKVVPCELFSCG